MLINVDRNAQIIEMWNEGTSIDAIARAAHCTPKAAYQIVQRKRVENPDAVFRRYRGFEVKSIRRKKRLNEIGRRLVMLFVQGRADPCQNLTTENVADLMGISTVTVRKVAKNGLLRGTKVNGRWAFQLGDVAEWARSL